MQISDEMVEAFGNAFWSVNAASKIDDQREHIRSALEAALSTDAEPVIMGDEDRTPMPIGFDEAIWRKADEVHHAMALVARDQECVKIIYAALSTHNAEPVKTAPAVAVKELRWKGPDSCGEYYSLDGLWGYIIRAESVGGFWLTEIGRYFRSPKAAQAAAQADYEARILSALSAQVQNVACSHLREILERWRDGCGFNEDSDEDVALLERASRVAKHGGP